MKKTAEQRAEETLKRLGFEPDAALWATALALLTVAFKEHARDQRHACAEAVYSLVPVELPGGVVDYEETASAAPSLVMNTPEPGR